MSAVCLTSLDEDLWENKGSPELNIVEQTAGSVDRECYQEGCGVSTSVLSQQ